MLRKRPLSKQANAVLLILRARPTAWRYGYDISKLTDLRSGTLYPLLIRLHERGLLEAKWLDPERPGRPARHVYRLSASGAEIARTLRAADASEGLAAREALA